MMGKCLVAKAEMMRDTEMSGGEVNWGWREVVRELRSWS